MLNNKDYCDYDTCVALEELGFPLHPYGNTEIDTALRLTLLLYEAQKWLREEKNISVFPERNSFGWYCGLHWFENSVERNSYPFDEVSSYEEALLEGIKEAIKILKEKKQ